MKGIDLAHDNMQFKRLYPFMEVADGRVLFSSGKMRRKDVSKIGRMF